MGIDWVDGKRLLEWQTGILKLPMPLSKVYLTIGVVYGGTTGWNWGLVE